MKFRIWKYEIIIQKAYFSDFHITDNPSSFVEEKPYVHDFNPDKRLRALIKKHGLIEYVFRDLDSALTEYGADAILLIECVLEGLGKIRNALESSKMPEEMVKQYDDKIYVCYNRLITILKDRGDVSNAKILKDYHVAATLKDCGC